MSSPSPPPFSSPLRPASSSPRTAALAPPTQTHINIGAISASPAGAWEDLRKQARKLESLVYSKLCEYSQSVTAPAGRPLSSDSEGAPLLNGAQSSGALEGEIESLLGQLSSINDSMSVVLSQQADGSVDSNVYTLQRYKAILHDYSQEFRKTKETINNARMRAELMAHASVNGVRPRADPLLREKDKLHHTLRLTESAIAQAGESKEALHSQGAVFRQITNKLAMVGQKFPVVNQLVQRIRVTKNRDTLIIAALIAALILFTIVYWANKP